MYKIMTTLAWRWRRRVAVQSGLMNCTYNTEIALAIHVHYVNLTVRYLPTSSA
jgi:hypothetical protein